MREGYRTWSTEGMPEEEQFAYWTETVQRVFGPMRFSREGTGGFRMTIVQTHLGPLTLSSVHAQEHRAVRDRALAERDTSELVYVNIPRMGALNGRQFSRELALDDGWVGMLAGRQPATVVASGEFRQYVIGLPAELVTPRLADPWTAGVATGALPALLSRRTRHLFSRASRFTREEAGLLANQLADLVVVSFGASGSGERPASRIVLQGAMDEAMRRLDDRTLAADDLARRVNVSRRTLEKLFAARGLTVHSWLLRRRLERAREDLETTGVPIEVLAHRWGFADRTHFSRVFRAQFGCSPAQYRRMLRSPG
jgi:AraC-like DNA-binding protein